MSSDVAVIIVSHNQGSFLRSAIDSVLHQTLNPERIVLINNGSTDETESVTRHYVDLYYPHVVSFIYQHNHGQIVAFNKGLELSTLPYTCFLDADDELDRRYLAQTTHILNENRKIGVVYTDTHLFGPREKSAWLTYPAAMRGKQGSAYTIHAPDYSESMKFELKRRNYINNSAVFRTKEAVDCGGFEEHERYDPRHYLWYKLYDRGHEGARVPHPLFRYRQHSIFQSSWQWRVRKIHTNDLIDKQILYFQQEIERLKSSPFYKTEQILNRLAENFQCDCEK